MFPWEHFFDLRVFPREHFSISRLCSYGNTLDDVPTGTLWNFSEEISPMYLLLQ